MRNTGLICDTSQTHKQLQQKTGGIITTVLFLSRTPKYIRESEIHVVEIPISEAFKAEFNKKSKENQPVEAIQN